MRLYWLSFIDEMEFLGCAVVEVTEEDAQIAGEDVRVRFPMAAPEAGWIAAAIKKAWATHCNPGGHVASALIEEVPEGFPLHTLLSKDQLRAWIEID